MFFSIRFSCCLAVTLPDSSFHAASSISGHQHTAELRAAEPTGGGRGRGPHSVREGQGGH